VRGSEASTTVDRSPMSMPISRVGVATSTFGAEGSPSARRNPSSYSRRVTSSRIEECSRATMRRMSAEAYSSR